MFVRRSAATRTTSPLAKVLLLAVAALFGGAQVAHAAGVQTAFVVTNSTDAAAGVAAHCQTATLSTGSCSLRDAITAASAVASVSTPATITFSSAIFTAATTITETQGVLTIPTYTTITGLTTGTGAALTNLITVSGNNTNTVFQTAPGGLAMKLANLIITGGNFAGGGGVFVNIATSLTIAQSTVTNNKSTSFGGGISNAGTLTVTQSTISGNTSSTLGAGIYSSGTLTMSASTISGNTSSTNGGGIYIASGTVLLTHDTISANKATTTGGGIYVAAGTVTLTSSVVGGNTATGSYADLYGTAVNVTSLVNTSSATTTPLATSPSLSALGSYGGPTQTMPVLPGLITNDTIAFCFTSAASAGTAYTDQRGVVGPTNYNGTYCTDAGATESSFGLAYTVQPLATYVVNTTMGSTTAPSLSLTDDGLAYAGGTGSVVFTDASGVIAGTTTVAFSSGIATPSAVKFSSVTGGDTLIGTYTLTLPSTSTANLTATSTAFNVTATPTVVLTISSPITYGTTLAGLTPTATANGSAVPGYFSYTATISGGTAVAVGTGTVLTPGTYSIVATFLPTNATLYGTGNTATATLVVTKATPVVTFTLSAPSIFLANTVTLTASVPAVGAGLFPTGAVTFQNGSTGVASPTLSPVGSLSNTVSYVYTPTSSGAKSMTAVYAGDGNYNTVTSTVSTETVVDISLVAASASIQTTKGATVSTVITLTPIGGTSFPGVLTLTAATTSTGGVTESLSPTTIASGATTGSTTLTIVISSTFAKMEMQHGIDPRVNGYAPVAFALLLLPFANRMRKAGKRFKAMTLMLLLSVCALGSMTGCGGKYHGTSATSNIAPVIVTATNGAASRTVTVTAVVAE
jgi:hypothetical protein